jgi:lysozyme
MSIKSQLAALGLTGSLLSGAVLIAIHEGEIHHTYLDPVGISTACFGHTGRDVKLGMVFSRDQCLMLLATDLEKFNKALGKLAPALTEGEHIAYLSFIYNVGTKAFSTSTLRKKFLNGERAAACDELLRWVYAKGRRLPGLVKRRSNERRFCMRDLQNVQ